ncbi:tRNA lysidine(34) synthetase TilS [Helicobacter muridarum]|uniref:tRNA(Ile)-lysidine synthase n=1 Tax=Helicobacter muridarum TaxID=216 RepID=A0A377PSH4_9HELI|nr:tRNA lysidine(34) synthetase TilS [Helicobacter muridarum]TLD98818.1 tRNA lysidine(34) synthetase TilS [Helicobacter muridarum]STQ85796.1 tRNA(Ile)-lysidine synthase [Helicobacter muridarum]
MQISLSKDSIEVLRKNKNLLAFSGGVDSSALFFILLSYEIDFDLVIVDYGLRKQSDEEIQYAKSLSMTYNKNCYVMRLCYDEHSDLSCSSDFYISRYLESLESNEVLDSISSLDFASLNHKQQRALCDENLGSSQIYLNPIIQQYNLSIKPIHSNFEHCARKVRYEFFSFLIRKNSYQNLVLAHHLDDKIEWFFMQFAKGAGLNSLLGFIEIDIRYTGHKSYNILRPLINIRKQHILAYNKSNGINYFVDSSNASPKHRRNTFRASLQKLFNKDDTMGILRSFAYLHDESSRLYRYRIICVERDLLYFKRIVRCDIEFHDFNSVLAEEIHHIDIMTKRLGYIMSSKQKIGLKDMLCFRFVDSKIVGNITSKDCMVGNRIIVGVNKDLIFVGICADWSLRHASINSDIKDSKICKIWQIAKDLESPKFQIPKQYIEMYRKLAIPKRIRRIMYRNLVSCFVHSS